VGATARFLTTDGFEAVKFGMTRAEAEKALGARLKMTEPADDALSCSYWSRSDGHDKEVGYMFQGGRITRIDIDLVGVRHWRSSITSSAGIGVGATEAEIKKVYRHHVLAKPDPYMRHPAQFIVQRSGPS